MARSQMLLLLKRDRSCLRPDNVSHKQRQKCIQIVGSDRSLQWREEMLISELPRFRFCFAEHIAKKTEYK